MITPIEANGIISRTQDISIIKQNEDARGDVAHLQTQSRFDDRQDQYVHTVHASDDANEPDTHHDAKEKGKNQYFSNRKKSEKKKESEDKVVSKSYHGFDISI